LEKEQKENTILRPKYSYCIPYCAVLDITKYQKLHSMEYRKSNFVIKYIFLFVFVTNYYFSWNV
jgi:hypothetical protein